MRASALAFSAWATNNRRCPLPPSLARLREFIMRCFTALCTAPLFVTAVHLVVSGQEVQVKPSVKAATQPAAKAPPPGKGAAVAKDPDDVRPPAKPADSGSTPSPDEIAIRKTAESYLKAFDKGDAKAAADHFTAEAEYVDEHGTVYRSRAAIEKLLAELFSKYPKARMELQIESIRFVGPGIAIEDGMSKVIRSEDSDPVLNRYTAVHMKTDGKWLVASVRDFPAKPLRTHRNQLHQFNWLLGEWVHEGADAVVIFSCKPIDNGNYLQRDYKIKIGGQDLVSGSQRIGWDAASKRFVAWVFDSDGGHSQGNWNRDGDSWILKTAGVTADGQSATNTSIYTFVNDHTMTFQSVNHEVAGILLQDGPKVTIVRHAPKPE